jgi:hypothetical protein
MITRLTQLIEGTTNTVESSPWIIRRRGPFDILMTQRSGAKFIAPRGMIWKSAKLSWIGRRCHHQQRRRRRSPGELINVGQILTEMSIWGRSMLSSGGSMSIASKTQGKKLQHEISLAQHIEPGRRIR